MNCRNFLKGLAGLASCPLCGPGTLRPKARNWSHEGETGPVKWDEPSDAQQGVLPRLQQSPVDIAELIRAQLPPLNIAWRWRADTIVNNGHTIKPNLAEGSSLTLGATPTSCCRCISPAERASARRQEFCDGDVLRVFRHADRRLAVVGVLFVGRKAEPTFSKIVTTMPGKQGPAPAVPAIDPNGLLPERRATTAIRAR